LDFRRRLVADAGSGASIRFLSAAFTASEERLAISLSIGSVGVFRGIHFPSPSSAQRTPSAVIDVTRDEARRFKCNDLGKWLDGLPSITPRKADQDMLDAAICLLIAMRWRLAPRHCSTMLGDVVSGYIVAPVSAGVRACLANAARERKLPMDEDVNAIPAESM
jgi:hypothetical protein